MSSQGIGIENHTDRDIFVNSQRLAPRSSQWYRLPDTGDFTISATSSSEGIVITLPAHQLLEEPETATCCFAFCGTMRTFSITTSGLVYLRICRLAQVEAQEYSVLPEGQPRCGE